MPDSRNASGVGSAGRAVSRLGFASAEVGAGSNARELRNAAARPPVLPEARLDVLQPEEQAAGPLGAAAASV